MSANGGQETNRIALKPRIVLGLFMAVSFVPMSFGIAVYAAFECEPARWAVAAVAGAGLVGTLLGALAFAAPALRTSALSDAVTPAVIADRQADQLFRAGSYLQAAAKEPEWNSVVCAHIASAGAAIARSSARSTVSTDVLKVVVRGRLQTVVGLILVWLGTLAQCVSIWWTVKSGG